MARTADPKLSVLAVSVPQAAAMLSVSPATIRQLLGQGVLPYAHIGTALRIPVSAIEALVAPQPSPPIIEGFCEEEPDDGGV